MNITAFLIIFFYIVLIPFIFQLLQYLRIEEIFRRGTPSLIISLTYIAIAIAMSQLIVNYFVSLFQAVDNLF